MSVFSKKKKVVAIIQARMGSIRLPGKVLMKIGAKTVLEWVFHRLSKAERIDHLVVATSGQTNDAPIAALCRQLNITCFRGSENNVLQRFYQAAKQQRADVIVRITADCPLVDPALIDQIIKRHLENDNDYTASDVGGTYPRGMDVEVFNFTALATAYKLATAAHHQEHVTSFIYNNPDLFQVGIVVAPKALSFPRLRVCVDEPADLELVRRICAHFSPRGDFTLSEMISLIKHHPAIARINGRVKQKTMVRRYIFRVDGSRRLGFGHVARSISLANELAKQGEILFIYRNEPVVGRLLKAHNFRAQPLKKGQKIDHELSLYCRDDIMITDSPLIDSGYLKRVKERVGLLASIYYGGNDIFYPSDIVINPNLSKPKIDLSKRTRYYSGSKYVIIGGSYRHSAGAARKSRQNAEELLVCFGGSDPNDITHRLVNILKQPDFDQIKKIVVAGPAYKNLGQLSKAVRTLPKGVLKSAVDDMSLLLKETDLAVISGGVLMHEAAALGVPSIIVSHNGEQNAEARAFQRAGVAHNLGIHDRVSDRTIAKALNSLIDNAKSRQKMGQKARRTIDTNGALRIAALIGEEARAR